MIEYKFGPSNHLHVALNHKANKQYGLCSASPEEKQFIIQLICHAALQMSEGTNGNGLFDRSNSIWTLRCVEADNYITYEPKKMPDGSYVAVPKRRTAHYTHPIYDLSYEGALVFSMTEVYDGYEVTHVDFDRLDDCIDSFLDYALEHANRFGRRG